LNLLARKLDLPAEVITNASAVLLQQAVHGRARQGVAGHYSRRFEQPLDLTY
jgi:hypothetical protein